ncbi:MAG: oligosaccharide flippase family protein [Planctomycetota bacterium]
MSLSRRVSVNAVGQIAGRLYGSGLAFVITALILPRRLSAAEFGIFVFYLTLYQLLHTMLDFGAGTIVIREASRDRARAGQLIGMLIGLKGRLALAAALLLLPVALWFDGLTPRAALLGLAALHLLCHAPAGAAAIFHVDMAFGRAILAGASGQTAWLLGTVVLVFAGVTEPALYLLVFGLGSLVQGAASYVWARRRVQVRFDATREERRRLWSESWPAGVSLTMAAVYYHIDAVMLRPMVGEVAVAHYGAAYRLMGFVLMVPVLFSQVVFPVFSRLWGAGPAALRPVFENTAAFLLGLGVLVPPVVWLVRHDVMALIFPPEYAAGGQSLGILSLAIVLVFGAYPHVLALLAAGEQRLMMRLSITGAALNVGLNLVLIPRLGISGAAWATVATEGFILASTAWAVRRRTGLALPPSRLARPAACATFSALALLALLPLLDGPVAWRVGAGLAAGLAALACSGLLPLKLGEDEPPASAPLPDEMPPAPGAPAP